MKNNTLRIFVITLFTLFTFTFLLNFLWESLHSVYLYEGHDFSSLRYVNVMVYVSMIDGLLVIVMYLITAAIYRKIIWLQDIVHKYIFTFISFGIIITTVIEYRALYVLDKWSYTELMPTIFTLGLSPLVQLSITGIIALLLTRQVLFQKGIFTRFQGVR